MTEVCPSLLTVLAEVPDPRGRRGKRHPLTAILTLAVAATLCGAKSYAVIAEWGRNYGPAFAQALGFTHLSTPCAACLFLLNRSLLQQRDDETFCTAVFARLEPARSGARLTPADAGHPCPLLLRRDGRVEAIGEPSLFLGVQPDVQFSSQVVDLKSEDAPVRYTDGVTEARVPGELFGEERLAKLVESCVGLDASSIVRSIEQRVMEFQGGNPRDDVAILALRIRQ